MEIMKNLKYLIIPVCIFILSATSCTDWLDVNTDPDNPNNESALVQNRLPWIEHFFSYSAGVTNYRSSCTAGVYYSSGAAPNAWGVTWGLTAAGGSTTTSYQTWFIEAAPNITDLYKKAQKEGAYYYMAAADVFHAMGFMQMLDLYGEMPYTEALSGIASPAYDDGKTIFEGCIAKLDEAIELFGKTQEPGATQFSIGDMWNNGDVNKWLKMCYGLKARYLLKLSKKTDFNAQAVLDCLAKAPQSNDENTKLLCFNISSDIPDYFLGDPVMTNPNWDYVAYGSTQRISQYYFNLLTNLRNSGTIDPRMSKIVPATMSDIRLDASGKVQSYKWLRSKGVDFYGASTRLVKGGPLSIQTPTFANADVNITYTIANEADRTAFIESQKGIHAYTADGNTVTVTYTAGSLYVNSTNYIYAGDTIYVNMRQNSTLTGNGSLGEKDMNWYYTTQAMAAGAVGSTGSFQTRPNSDFDYITYYEMCFIKAEVYMRTGDKAKAFAAYQDGIRAHFDRMQSKLTDWKSAGFNNPDMWPMDAAEIAAYLGSSAVCQNAAELTMTDIMLQKYIAMGCSVETWNDMRRFNFSAGNVSDFGVVYPGYDRGPLFAGQAELTGSSKTDPKYWQRRWRLPGTLELTYNSTQANAINVHAGDPYIWCLPVWWDCTTDQEYFDYIQK